MRTTVTIDDALMEDAAKLTGINERGPLIREALKTLIARESARRLIALGGSDPGATAAPRRRFPQDREE
ncbi:type II toxin-antitoxin system VapB family antitoxin [Novosphingopyxis sp.]|uniref:type II toxin-antitoxin system VapB family antitoxin n=1 Tax=Novosphingopyxis sp. TaxID=2709690 RepID=UPI003B5A4AB5